MQQILSIYPFRLQYALSLETDENTIVNIKENVGKVRGEEIILLLATNLQLSLLLTQI